MGTVTGGAPAPCKPSHARLDTLEPLPEWCLVPDGRKLTQVPPVQLSKIVAQLGIPGLDATLGYEAKARAYRDHLQKVYDLSGRAAVRAWLGGSR